MLQLVALGVYGMHGYSAYNPENIIKVLNIFRVFYNYTLEGKDSRTPAVRLGLAKGIVSPEQIVYGGQTAGK